jgi:ATP-dependent Clp protease protease subunit
LRKLKRRINKNEEEEKKESINLMDLQLPPGPPPLRTIGLFGDLDEDKTEDVCSGLLYLQHTAKIINPGEEEGTPKPITFYVSTWGGDALGMFGIYDLMRMVRQECPIQTHGLGKVMSAGVLLLAAGTKGQRKIGKHCRVMMHAVRGGHVGSIHSLENEMEETRWIQRQHIKALCEETDLTERQLKKMLNKNMDVYLSAEDAVNYGIADIIV